MKVGDIKHVADSLQGQKMELNFEEWIKISKSIEGVLSRGKTTHGYESENGKCVWETQEKACQWSTGDREYGLPV